MDPRSVSRIAPEAAAARLKGLARLDPRGMTTEADILPMCRAGLCLEVSDSTGVAVVVVELINGVAWVNAAGGGGGANLSHTLDDVVAGLGASSVAFQTSRPGLVRRAHRRGFQTVGYILRRTL